MFQGDPSKLDEGIRFVRDQGLPPIRQQPGYQGARMLVDRQSGKTIGFTLWENEAAARAVESTLIRARAQTAQLVGSALNPSEIFEMVIDEDD
jgi:hypothetical protein